MSVLFDKSIRKLAEEAAEELDKLEGADEHTRRSFVSWVTTSPRHIEEALAMAELNETLASVLEREWASSNSPEPRTIIKYPNRRLYDMLGERYLALDDLRRLVIECVDFVVVDKATRRDITRPILMQLIAGQECGVEPVMSLQFLLEVIRSYGSTSRKMICSYLEQSLKLFATQQRKDRDKDTDETNTVATDGNNEVANNPTQMNWMRLQHLSGQCYGGEMGTGRRSAKDSAIAAAAPCFSECRVIRKYPNRNLYDTVESRYITLTDIRELVTHRIDFVVVDKQSKVDITRPLLWQLIAALEHGDDPLMSREFLLHVIRSHGGATQEMISNYLEQILKSFVRQQFGNCTNDADVTISAAAGVNRETIHTLAYKNYMRWRNVQDEIYRELMQKGRDDHDAPDSDQTTRSGVRYGVS